MSDELTPAENADELKADADSIAAEPTTTDEAAIVAAENEDEVAPVVTSSPDINEALLEEQAPALEAAQAKHAAAIIAAEEQYRLAPEEFEVATDGGQGAALPRTLRAEPDEDGFWTAVRAADAEYEETTAGFEARKPANPQPEA